jgi:hypothetical protein
MITGDKPLGHERFYAETPTPFTCEPVKRCHFPRVLCGLNHVVRRGRGGVQRRGLASSSLFGASVRRVDET